MSINALIENLEDLISKSLTASINVEVKLSDDLWPVKIDAGDFEDAMLNLALNARDAMPEGGMLLIETINKIVEDHSVRFDPKIKPGEYAMISVSDTGRGMTPDIKEKVFEPFFTTKQRGKGT